MLYDHHILDKEEILACYLELKRKKIQINHTYIVRIHSRQNKTRKSNQLFFPAFTTRRIMFNFWGLYLLSLVM